MPAPSAFGLIDRSPHGVVVAIPTLPAVVAKYALPDTESEVLDAYVAFNLVPSNVKAELSLNAPPVVMYGMRLAVRDETASEVVVALVVVLFTAVKFWRVVEPVMRRFANVERPETVRVPCPVREFETIICEVEASAPIWRDV